MDPSIPPFHIMTGVKWLFRKACLHKELMFAVCMGMFLCLGFVYNITEATRTFSTIDWLQEYEEKTLESQIKKSVWELYPENSTDATLARKVQVLCWVMTNPNNHANKALAVKNTWGERCNILLFISSTYDPSLPSIPLVNHEGRDYLWTKTVAAFKYVYSKGFLDEVDWVLKADDDTFMVMENLRLYLNDFDPNRDLYFGFLLKWPNSNPYMAGGPGYVLSRTSARRFVEEALLSGNECSEEKAPYEDMAMGNCMLKINAEFVDTRDEQGRNRFLNNPPVTYLGPDPLPGWYKDAVVHNITKGMYKCCADATISFHYIEYHNMYQMYYNTYRLHPVSIQSKIPSKTKARKRRNTGKGRSRLLRNRR